MMDTAATTNKLRYKQNEFRIDNSIAQNGNKMGISFHNGLDFCQTWKRFSINVTWMLSKEQRIEQQKIFIEITQYSLQIINERDGERDASNV